MQKLTELQLKVLRTFYPNRVHFQARIKELAGLSSNGMVQSALSGLRLRGLIEDAQMAFAFHDSRRRRRYYTLTAEGKDYLEKNVSSTELLNAEIVDFPQFNNHISSITYPPDS